MHIVIEVCSSCCHMGNPSCKIRKGNIYEQFDPCFKLMYLLKLSKHKKVKLTLFCVPITNCIILGCMTHFKAQVESNYRIFCWTLIYNIKQLFLQSAIWVNVLSDTRPPAILPTDRQFYWRQGDLIPFCIGASIRAILCFQVKGKYVFLKTRWVSPFDRRPFPIKLHQFAKSNN